MSSFPECTEPDTVTKGGYSARSSSEPHPHPKKQRITSSSSSSSDSSDDTNGGKTKTRKKLETSSGIADRLSGLDRGKDESKLAFEVRVQAHRKLLRMVQWIPPAHIFMGDQIADPQNGRLGVCSCPGLLDTRPSRDADAAQRSLLNDITTLTGLHQVTDIFVIACDWEIKHYNGVTNQEYVAELEKQGLTVHSFSVQESKPPTLQMCLDIHTDLANCLAQGKKVVLHSRKSWGRAPTVVATYLMRCHPEILPDVAIDHVRSCCGRHAVQTVKQYNHIHEFHEYQQSSTTL